MDNKKDIDLRKAFPEMPDMCHNAVLQAVSTYQEEQDMKRSYRIVLIAAVIFTLMCGVAFAISQYYSVREYVAMGNPSTAFEQAIVPIGQSKESNGLTITLGDAVCDGSKLAFTLDIVPKEDASPVYVYPELRGFYNGEPLDIYYDGFDFSGGPGAIIPSLNSDEQLITRHRGIKVNLPEPLQSGKIDWTYTLHLYKPIGKLVADERTWTWTDDPSDSGKGYYHNLYEKGEIPVVKGNWISGNYLFAFASDWDEYINLSENELVERTGLFEMNDTVEFNFSTEVTGKKNLTKETVHIFDEYTVTVKSITTSFMQVVYELEVVYNEPQPSEHELEQFYVLIDDNGNILSQHDRGFSLAEDKRTCTVYGSAKRITDTSLTAITFRLDHEFTINQNDSAEDMPSFTVTLDK